nr:hypothetical protein [uncultured Draconibacterium sp.]
MSGTTVDSMNFHLQQVETKSDLRMSNAMKDAIERAAKKLQMKPSAYKRMAINERLQKDLTEQ